MKLPVPLVCLSAAALVLFVTLGGAPARAATTGGAEAVTVAAGPQPGLRKDCQPWTPRGLSFFGRLVPRGWQTDPGTMAAQAGYSQWAIDAVRAIGGDTLRLQVGMPFLDPQSPTYNAGYLDEVRQAVAQARSQHLVVILSMQWEGRTGVKPVEMLPKESALRAWEQLGPVFANDPGVVYELFNEPASTPQAGPGFWAAWRGGHQAIIDSLRGRRIRNTLLVDGLYGAKLLEGAPELADPLQRLAYGVHPYFGPDLNTPALWDAHFGRFAERHAVLVTEWSHAARDCEAGDGATVDRFIDYLAEHRIGLIGYGADEHNGGRLLTIDGPRRAPTSYAGKACNARGAGPGEAIRRLFQRAADADARAPRGAPADCAAP